MQRKHFLKLSTAAAAFIPALGFPVAAFSRKVADDNKIMASFIGDGLHHNPTAYVQLLSQLIAKRNPEADSYSRGGAIEILEKKFAAMLGKETAIFMPTGTMANHLAIRTLAAENKRVIVQEESHIYNDTGDGCQTLSNLNLIPLGSGKASFTLEELSRAVEKNKTGRVATNIGVIAIESPVRRKSGEVFDYEEMKKIAGFAKENRIKMHLDGARIFLAPAYTGVSVMEYASLFDTVYVSLYKYFNAASGAILAGPKEIITPMYHTRRMFGGGLNESWPYALVAGHYADGFEERFARSVAIAEDLLTKLGKNNRIGIHRISSGTNIFKITLKGITAAAFAANLKTRGVSVRTNSAMPDGLFLQVNESLLTTNADALENIFIESLNS